MPSQPPSIILSNAHTFGSTAIAFSNDGKQLASGGFQGEILLWQIHNFQKINELKLHTKPIRTLVYTNRGNLFSSGEDGQIIFWDLATAKPIKQRQSSAVVTLVIQDEQIFSAHEDGFLRVWKLSQIELKHEINIGNKITALALHNSLLAVAQDNGKVQLYDTQLNLVRTLQKRGKKAYDLRFSRNGEKLIAGNWFTLHIWNLITGEQTAISTEHNGIINSLDFSPDGNYLVTLGRFTDSAIRLWNTHTMQMERRYAAHELCGAMIRFSPDGHYIASTSDDESIRLYNLNDPYKPYSLFKPH